MCVCLYPSSLWSVSWPRLSPRSQNTKLWWRTWNKQTNKHVDELWCSWRFVQQFFTDFVWNTNTEIKVDFVLNQNVCFLLVYYIYICFNTSSMCQDFPKIYISKFTDCQQQSEASPSCSVKMNSDLNFTVRKLDHFTLIDLFMRRQLPVV